MLPLALAAALHLCLAAPPARPPQAKDARAPAPAEPFDVRGYPPAQRARFELFRQKCAKCHSLAVAAAAPLTAGQLRRHLKRPGVALAPAHAESIAAFLALHAERRAAR